MKIIKLFTNKKIYITKFQILLMNGFAIFLNNTNFNCRNGLIHLFNSFPSQFPKP